MLHELLNIKELENELKTLKNEFNKEFHNKLIKFKAAYNESVIDKEGYNFRLSKVIPEENSIEVTYDVFEEDKTVKCSEFLTIEQFIKFIELT
jgi:hypothetical protein